MRCPGQDSRFWGADAVCESSCPNCGEAIEFFKDESSRKCRRCGAKALNPKMDFGCAAYCRFAARCMGADMPRELSAGRADLLRERVAAEVKRFLGRDFARIGRALKAVEYAGRIQKEEGGDPAVITVAACLWAIGGAGSFSPEEADAAGSILARAGAPEEVASEVLSVLNRLGGAGGAADPVNVRCVFDAVRIARLSEAIESGRLSSGGDGAGGKPFFTRAGNKLMAEIAGGSIDP